MESSASPTSPAALPHRPRSRRRRRHRSPAKLIARRLGGDDGGARLIRLLIVLAFIALAGLASVYYIVHETPSASE